MRYKGEYSPSYLADPVSRILIDIGLSDHRLQETCAWFPLPTCLPLLDEYRYACFENPDNSMISIPEVEEGSYVDI